MTWSVVKMSQKESHRSYTTSFKLNAVKIAEEQGKRKASQLLNVDRKRIREWCQQKEKLMTLGKCAKRSPGAGRRVRYADIDEKLIEWFSTRRDMGVRVTGKALRQEALRLHKENGSQSFKASSSWFRCFKRRHNISFRRTTHIAQKSVDITNGLVDKFLKFVLRMRGLRNYELSQIANMDETPVYLEMPGKSTLDVRGKRDITVKSTGHEKEKITVTLGAYADGTKMSPLVHLTGIRPLPKADIPCGIIVYMCGSGKKSWANEESILFWLQKLWGRNNLKKRLLVWDAFRAHLTSKVKNYLRVNCNSDMCVIPGGCTSRLQPADVSWNKPFKAKFAELYDEWLFSGPVEKTPKGNRRAPPKALVLQWIKTAWDSITPAIIRKSFLKCGISTAMDGSEDHLLFSHDSDDEAEDFEGFDPTDIDIGVQLSENVAVVLSESDAGSSESEDQASDYDSPGH